MSTTTEAAIVHGVDVHGTCDPRFAAVQEAFEKNLRTGEDIGASAAVFIDGEPFVDIWAGFVDDARTRPWQRDTIVNNFSTTKTMTALAALVLADRGELDFEAPVAEYWPEFAAEGKRSVLVQHLLAHTSGLPGWTEPVTIDDILDREKARTLLARQAPWFKPGSTLAYHAITYGPLIGEVIRRITGRTLGAFFAEEVAGPLGADYHIGTGPECDARVSPMIQGSPYIQPGLNSVQDRVFFNPFVTPQIGSSVAWRRAELGGSNGHGNARSVAAIQSVFSNGGEARGVRLLSPAGCERALTVLADAVDPVMGLPLRFGLGYSLNSPAVTELYGPAVDGHRLAFWGGSGGSFVMNDLDTRMTVAFVMNRHLEHGGLDHRATDVIRAAYACLPAGGRRS
ncbi:MAG TPA: serine hydrolase domain-containing protein [Vicinamibacterales bacterium]|jgi:CubicO group peptidase (beta-lactamase class C family)